MPSISLSSALFEIELFASPLATTYLNCPCIKALVCLSTPWKFSFKMANADKQEVPYAWHCPLPLHQSCIQNLTQELRIENWVETLEPRGWGGCVDHLDGQFVLIQHKPHRNAWSCTRTTVTSGIVFMLLLHMSVSSCNFGALSCFILLQVDR